MKTKGDGWETGDTKLETGGCKMEVLVRQTRQSERATKQPSNQASRQAESARQSGEASAREEASRSQRSALGVANAQWDGGEGSRPCTNTAPQ